ncbi:MAG: AMP-binding protein [Prevotella sp.]|nr:AMP-binding protein [Prevotella sp.]
MDLQTFLAEWQREDDRMTVCTSGSTGQPKPILVEKKRMLASARMTCDYLNLHEGDTALLCLPLDYIAGKMMVVRSLERELRLFSTAPTGHPLANDLPCAIDLCAMIPLQVYNSLENPIESERLRQIRHLIIGGSSVDERLEKQLRNFPNHVWSTYGMTETLSHIALRRLNGAQASEWYEAFEGIALSLDNEGCLVIDAPHLCAESLTTNDIAVLDIDHRRFKILGRRDNVIVSGGVKIQIEEVESLLHRHADRPFCITKRPDEKFGEAVVLLALSGDIPTFQHLCGQVLPKYWQPRCYCEVARLPMTPNGKVARREAERLARESLPCVKPG